MEETMEACKTKLVKCLKAAKTLVQPQTPEQAFQSRQWGFIAFNEYQDPLTVKETWY